MPRAEREEEAYEKHLYRRLAAYARPSVFFVPAAHGRKSTEAAKMDTEKRLGFIGVVMGDRSVASEVNALLSQYGSVIKARIGVPDADTPAAVIGLIVEGDNQALGSLTARLGNLPGVEVKSALTKKNRATGEPPARERD